MKKLFTSILAALLLLVGGSLGAQEDKILGTYEVPSPFSDDVAHVKITKTQKGTYQGRITWVNRDKNPDGTPRTDEKNPDPKLRMRPPTDIVMFWNLQYKEGEWVDGVLYDPYTGKRFSVKFKLAKNGTDLSARYYKGVPVAGINGTWKRIK